MEPVSELFIGQFLETVSIAVVDVVEDRDGVVDELPLVYRRDQHADRDEEATHEWSVFNSAAEENDSGGIRDQLLWRRVEEPLDNLLDEEHRLQCFGPGRVVEPRQGVVAGIVSQAAEPPEQRRDVVGQYLPLVEDAQQQLPVVE